ncbi:MAG: hypothetical protein IPM42_09935 [Saprospiraceae bacterium]|nr:hypothetical protein [Saprospiraceae bacterium]
MKYLITILILHLIAINVKGQDIALMNLGESLPRTYINPGLPVDGKFNLSLAGFQFELGTDGPTFNSLTSKNAAGKRFIDVSKFPTSFGAQNNIYFQNQIHGIDVSLQMGKFLLMAGHAFKSNGDLQYTNDLAQLLARGNASFIGQELQIGPALNLQGHNEIYLGLQNTIGSLTIGAKAKVLFGTASVTTEKDVINFTTDEEIYQLQFETDYLVRSSSLLKLADLENIEFEYSGLTFDNLFYNNRGFAFDLGASLKASEKLTLSASIIDIGSIKWDFFPRAYSSTGNFSFDGVDIIEYLGDTTGINLSDTIVDLLRFEEKMETYSTNLLSKIYLGGSYKMNEMWTFHALYRADGWDIKDRSSLAFSAVTRFSMFDVGVQYSMRKNNFNSFGLFGRITIGPVSIFAATENIQSLWSPLDQKLANVRLGGILKL